MLVGLTIPEYSNASYLTHVPARPRRVLLHRREIHALRERLDRERLTVVPLVLYWRRGIVKVLLGVVRGKKLRDKRAALREREEVRELERVLGRGPADKQPRPVTPGHRCSVGSGSPSQCAAARIETRARSRTLG